jgi:glycosyltransferase involved in cell wall biosynthesis
MENLNSYAGLPKRILIITDAWQPQINGVVRTLQTTVDLITKKGIDVFVIHPKMFDTIECPFYKEISLVISQKQATEKIKQTVETFRPLYIHIVTEGPLGYAGRKFCIKNNLRFTTAYHTKYPEYMQKMFPWIPFIKQITYAYVKNFHNASSNVMVASTALQDELAMKGFKNLVLWGRGANLLLFNPAVQSTSPFDHKYALYVGRISKEKQIENFLNTNTKKYDNMKKVVVGDGPELNRLMKKYPNVIFVGKKTGLELANYYRHASVFCFPSKTDTYGLVVAEALASGVPVAAYKTPNIEAIVNDQVAGLHETDFQQAIDLALKKDRTACRKYAEKQFHWDKCTRQFLINLISVQ